jgi:5-methylcytosine-specific restriction enzyme A
LPKLTSFGPRIASFNTRKLAPPPRFGRTVYVSAEWRALVRSIIAKRGRRCERCGSSKRLFGDHLEELRDGGAALDPANVELLCGSCHTAKTRAARAGA